MQTIRQLAEQARAAQKRLAIASSTEKNSALNSIAKALREASPDILAANQEDIKEGQAAGLSEALIDRLSLDGRLAGIIDGIDAVAALSDPVGEVFDARSLENGLRLRKQRTPIGVIGVIYEARPNVTVDVAALTLKSGNAVILRGGKETLRSNAALVNAIRKGLKNANFPEDAVQFIDSADRAHVAELLKMHELVDMIIPRGGAALHKYCRENSSIPVITGGIGVCHLYVDSSADLGAAVDVVVNAKVQRPSVCNSLDTVLVARSVATEFLSLLVPALDKHNVLKVGDAESLALLGENSRAADPEDWDREWLSLSLGVRIVPGCSEAIEHIHKHSSGHSDGILCSNQELATRFVAEVDSAAVYVNASTRFTDGAEFGLGAEVAISTQKLHARGPMGLQELCSYKWVVEGDMHCRP